MASLQNAKFAKANSFSGSTTSLTKHLDKIHQVEYTRATADKALEMQASRVVPVAAAGPSLVQPTLQQTLERHKLYDVASPRKQAIDEAVIEMIVRDAAFLCCRGQGISQLGEDIRSLISTDQP